MQQQEQVFFAADGEEEHQRIRKRSSITEDDMFSSDDLVEMGVATIARGKQMKQRYIIALKALKNAYPEAQPNFVADFALDFATHANYGQSQGVDRMNYAIIGAGLMLSFTGAWGLEATFDESTTLQLAQVYLMNISIFCHAFTILLATCYLTDVTIRAYGELDQLIMCVRFIWLRDMIQLLNYLGMVTVLCGILCHQYAMLVDMDYTTHAIILASLCGLGATAQGIMYLRLVRQTGNEPGHQANRLKRFLGRFCVPVTCEWAGV